MDYQVADIFFTVFHTLIILFNLFGWIWKKTRKWNLLLLILTGLSWSVLGIWYGFGYCPFTDWHWQVLSELGKLPETPSYTEYLTERLTGMEVSNQSADAATLGGFLLALIISSWLNFRDQHRKEQES
ncbi:DUF2784 domain-containing protein [Halocola ammonii]